MLLGSIPQALLCENTAMHELLDARILSVGLRVWGFGL